MAQLRFSLTLFIIVLSLVALTTTSSDVMALNTNLSNVEVMQVRIIVTVPINYGLIVSLSAMAAAAIFIMKNTSKSP